ncbi:MAG: type II toxin-antitoxin system VapC family toxin [Desulfobacterales bacterium]
MNLLLDTHVLLWWLDDHPALSKPCRSAMADGSNLVFVSAAVIWEIRIKQALGKLKIPSKFREVLDQQPFNWLPITVEHAHAIQILPAHHRDPFDRMLIAQARVEGFTMVTHDAVFRKYKIPLMLT